MALRLIALLFVVLGCALVSQAAPLNLHIIAHTHDDVGWLKTVDEYFYGANNTIQEAGVQYIIDTVVQQLQANPSRRFIYVEIAFFMRWWRQQDETTRSVVRDLVRNRQLEFVNGGWSMNDEACTFYTATIDQMTEGHRFLFENFGVRPNIGWQIDPFGHSSTQMALFAQMGFNAVFFARSDLQEYSTRKQNRALEFVWRPSKSLGSSTDIFTHIFYDSNYCEADGFSFQDDNVQPVMWDERLENYNLDKISDKLVSLAHTRSQTFRSSNIFFTFGCDFQFHDAVVNFKNMDRLIEYINAHEDKYGVKVFYSTPATYLEYVHKESQEKNIRFPENTADLFPYRDDWHAVWAGYFTSHAALKGYIRSRSNVLHGVSNLMTTAAGKVRDVLTEKNYENVDNLAQACGVTQHHDSVTGTAKEHVNKDYAKQLSIGTAKAQQVLNEVTGKLLHSKDSRQPVPTFSFCDQLNVSICAPLDNLNSQVVPIVIYNSLAWSRTMHIRLPVPLSSVGVVDSAGKTIPSQTYKNPDVVNKYTLAFSVEVGPLGFRSVALQKGTAKESFESSFVPSETQADVVLENGNLRVVISGTTGRLQSVTNKLKNLQVNVDQDISWYNASAGNNVLSGQTSGAYIFRPNGTHTWNITNNNVATIVSVITGSVVQEVRQIWANWAYQTIRLYSDADYIETETTIGPIPINDNLGKEVVTRYSTNIASQSLWYTDSNGQEFQQRQRNYRQNYKLNVTEPVALNYFPVNTAAYLEQGAGNSGARFTIITDRSHGCGSLQDGELEVMLHRRLLYDDFRGVGEPLNQSDIVRSTQWTFYDRPADSARKQRSLSLQMNGEPLLMFVNNWTNSASSFFSVYNTEFYPIARALPPNVHLLTLRTLNTGETLLRLNHIFAINEDSQYSTPVTVDLGNLFLELDIFTAHEMTLTANLPRDDMRRYTWNTTSTVAPESESAPTFTPVVARAGAYEVELKPMEIRTFLILFMTRN